MEQAKNYTTAQRTQILKYLQENKERTVTIPDISAYLEKEQCSANNSTIYRYLEKLANDGMINKYVAEKGKKAVYQYVDNPEECQKHLHLKCTRCGCVAHLDCAFMKEISGHMKEEHGFVLDCRHSMLYGLCSRCQPASHCENGKHEV
ncbi:MAG: transcriptional repressor [Clostridiales bacterium]|nr:transcriptional repressor [Clostridiales bacterium]